ncbi:hypothetical protein M9Y10_009742 [Tritrichomonas musculus]|uniref:Uncharacterized protein n=1 Tax=Tritrichomonas musculus TaxID=1915356 RepID=A0ABR2IP79_9EUKA
MDDELFEAEEEAEDKKKKPSKTPPRKRKTSNRVRLTPKEIEYAKSRLPYLHNLAASPSTTLFSLDASTIKLGYSSVKTQYKLDTFNQTTQTDSISYSEAGIQIPEINSQPRFPSLIHFLKAATSTVTALLAQSEFGTVNSISSPNSKKSQSDSNSLVRLSKYITETAPELVRVTSSRTYALVSDPAPLGKILVWTATSNQNQPAFYLISSASPSCFSVHGSEGQIVVAGTNSGSLLVWDLSRVEKTKQSGTALVIQPQATTDSMGSKNHRFAIVGINIFTASGTTVVCALDESSLVTFWYLRSTISSSITLSSEKNELSFVKAETVKLSLGYLPSFSLTMFPNSVNSFLVGSGGKIFNCCRFGSATSPSTFSAKAVAKTISFSPLLPQFFAASFDNGKVGIYNIFESDPLIELTINLSLGDTGVVWSPTRASVLFVSDLTGMRVYGFDLLLSSRTSVFTFKVGSAANSIDVAESNSGVILAVAEGSQAVTIYRVEEKLSKPLTDKEMNNFKLILYNSK